MEQYLRAFDNSLFTDDTPVSAVRFVVLDSETSGFDPHRDHMISIGAVVVQDGEILLDDTFEVTLRLTYNMASVTVHGITRDEARDGMAEPEAVDLFLDYLQDGVIVGHHIGHDIQFLNVACQRHFGMQLQNRALDTMDLTLRLKDEGAFEGQAQPEGFTLDSLCTMFGIVPHDRHTAGGDAFLTALVFLRLMRAAERVGYTTLGSLCVPYQPPA